MTNPPVLPSWLWHSLYFAVAAAIVNDLELLSLRRHMATDGLLAWPGKAGQLFSLKLLHKKDPAPLCLYLRLIGCAGVVAQQFWALILVAMATLVLQRRRRLGNNGSNVLVSLVFLTACWCNLVPTDTSFKITQLLLAAMLSLTYSTSAIAKSFSPSWRNGMALVKILSTDAFGRRWTGRLAALYPKLTQAAALGCVAAEFAFATAFSLPPRYCLVVLSAALIFHCCIAITMGLNTFVFAMAALYPPTLQIAHWLHKV